MTKERTQTLVQGWFFRILLVVVPSLFVVDCELCEMMIYDVVYVELSGYPLPNDATDQRCGTLTITIYNENNSQLSQAIVDTCTGDSTTDEYEGLTHHTCAGTTCNYVFNADPPTGCTVHHVNVQFSYSGITSEQTVEFEVIAREQTCSYDQYYHSASLQWVD